MRLRMGVLTISLCLALTACGGGAGISPAEQLALDIRGELLETAGCTAQLELTADYGQRVYTYGIDLSWQREGETALEYDGMRVETGPLDGSGMSPVDAVPVLLDYAEGGYIAACGMETVDEREVLRVDCREPEAAAGESRACSLWFDPSTHALLRGELSQDGFTVIQCEFSNFRTQ